MRIFANKHETITISDVLFVLFILFFSFFFWFRFSSFPWTHDVWCTMLMQQQQQATAHVYAICSCGILHALFLCSMQILGLKMHQFIKLLQSFVLTKRMPSHIPHKGNHTQTQRRKVTQCHGNTTRMEHEIHTNRRCMVVILRGKRTGWIRRRRNRKTIAANGVAIGHGGVDMHIRFFHSIQGKLYPPFCFLFFSFFLSNVAWSACFHCQCGWTNCDFLCGFQIRVVLSFFSFLLVSFFSLFVGLCVYERLRESVFLVLFLHTFLLKH